jgi:hypothetical protein
LTLTVSPPIVVGAISPCELLLCVDEGVVATAVVVAPPVEDPVVDPPDAVELPPHAAAIIIAIANPIPSLTIGSVRPFIRCLLLVSIDLPGVLRTTAALPEGHRRPSRRRPPYRGPAINVVTPAAFAWSAPPMPAGPPISGRPSPS